MTYVLDTCVVSEFFKSEPDGNVVVWFREQIPETLFISVVTLGEIRKGITRLPSPRRRSGIESWFSALKVSYDRRIIVFDEKSAEAWGRIRGVAELRGASLSMVDSMIAATALAHEHVVVTRNVQDFQRCGVETLDPWNAKAVIKK